MTIRTRVAVYGAILAVLVVLLALGAIFSPRPAELGPVFVALDPEEVRSIRLEETGTNLELDRLGDNWLLVEDDRQFPARSDRIGTFLDELASAQLVRKVTASESHWSEFGLADDARVIRLEITHQGASRTLAAVWGSASDEPGLSFVRFENGPDVFASDAQIDFYLTQPATYWSYLRLLPENLAASDVIALTGSIATSVDDEPLESEISWHKDDQTWFTGSGRQLVSDKVGSVARENTDLVGRDFHREPISAYSAVGDMTVDYADGRRFSVEFLQSPDGFVARASGPAVPGDDYGGLAYDIPGPTLRRIFPGESTLLE